jgi:predicted glycoside hydrolase/deacetylase ChbG (UPF0249 family)
MTRTLIVNADDFGRSDPINRGIATAFERGLVRSASLMVRWPAAPKAAEYAAAHPSLGVGLHFDLSEWRYDGDWKPVYEVLHELTPETVAVELRDQLDAFTRLLGRVPTHLDSHQHVHREEPIRSALVAAGRELGVPVRECTPGIVYRGDFYGQWGRGEPYPEGISLQSLLAVIDSLPAGVTELGCHPSAEPELESSYARERPLELAVLCDPRATTAVTAHEIELCSFADLPDHEVPRP